jgi:hypothetical protein
VERSDVRLHIKRRDGKSSQVYKLDSLMSQSYPTKKAAYRRRNPPPDPDIANAVSAEHISTTKLQHRALQDLKFIAQIHLQTS